MTPLQHRIWRSAFILAGLAAVTLIWLIPALNAACDRLAEDVRKAGGCSEFWLNRHQTSLQTLVTAILTATGLYFVVRQLNEFTTQNRLTAAALDGSRREQAANRRMVIARAISGVQAYSVAATTLMIELGRQRETLKSPKSPDELGSFASLAEANLSIYPVLTSPQLREKWKLIRDRFNSVSIFTLMNNNSLIMDAYNSDKTADFVLPIDHTAALLEVTTVIGQLRWLTNYLEGTAPND